jgi:hypothetical protein
MIPCSQSCTTLGSWYDAGDSMISLKLVRTVIDKPPPIVHGNTSAFADFAGAGAVSGNGELHKTRLSLM